MDGTSQNAQKTDFRPKTIVPYEYAERRSIDGSTFFVIKNLRNDKYIKVSATYYQVLRSINGTHNIEELYNHLTSMPDEIRPEEVHEYLGLLARSGFFEDTNPDDQEDDFDPDDARKSILDVLITRFAHTRVAIPNTDSIISRVYSMWGRLIFTKPILIIAVFLAVIGICLTPLSVITIFANLQKYPSPLLTLPIVWLALFLSMAIHELSHALTCRHYGRNISALGLILYFGIPGAFVDTTDAYMLSKWKRIAIDMAGICANITIGSLSIIASLLVPAHVGFILLLVGGMNYFLALFNLFPFLKYDGYYALVDFLEYPNLRETAISRVLNRQHWYGLLAKSKASLEDIVLTLFGVGSISFTLLVVGVVALQVGGIMYQIAPEPIRFTVPFAVLGMAGYGLIKFAKKYIKQNRH